MFITGAVMDSNPASVPEPVAAVSSRIVIAWECGSCRMTNEDMMRCFCHICGQQRPVCYLIVGGPIKPQFGGRRWYGRCAEPIDAEEENVANDDIVAKDNGDDNGKGHDKDKS